MISNKKNSDMFLTIALTVVIIVTISVIVYINFSQQKEMKTSQLQPEVVLSIVYDKQQLNYTLKDLQNMETYTGYGGYKTRYPSIKGPYEYTGVNVTTLLEKVDDLPTNYMLKVIASDGWVSNYTINQIEGNVTVYDTTGNKTGVGGVTMLLAYAEAGYYNFSDGPLRIAYISDDEPITDSFLWAKYVVSMEIIAEE